MGARKYDLEDRLIDFAIKISEIVEELPNTKFGNYLGGQMIRSGTSPSLNNGEAQSAESKDDFIHKLKVILKELRETRIGLKIILRKPLLEPGRVEHVLNENNELIAIFITSIETARKRKS